MELGQYFFFIVHNFVYDKRNLGHPFILFKKRKLFSKKRKLFSICRPKTTQQNSMTMTCNFLFKNKVFLVCFFVVGKNSPTSSTEKLVLHPHVIWYIFISWKNIATFHALLVIQMHCYKS